MKRWFDRTFDLGLPASEAPALIDRLARTPARVEQAVRRHPLPLRAIKPDGRWSIQEHAGHLLDLEPLWAARLDDFEAGRTTLHAADLDNRRTHEANHNARDAGEIAAAFRRAREAILTRLARLTPDLLSRTALHPRLQQPMSVVDLCFFVAEHDDHHLGVIEGIAARFAGYPSCALELLASVDGAVDRLSALSDEDSARKPGPDRWSPREILGHLIDSASNNHQRFVRAQFTDDLVFDGYAQDDWVAAQRYQEAPWPALLALWAGFNRHLARVMAATPEEARRAPRARHSLDRLAFEPVPASRPATLDYLMQDYVRHLQHHLRQISWRNEDRD